MCSSPPATRTTPFSFYSWASPGLAIAERHPPEFVGENGLETDIEAAARRGGAGSLASGSSCRYTRPAVA
jgi:hypothetical protein